jgi:hypothetical protein
MRPVWGSSEPLTTVYLMYAQRFDVVRQSTSETGCELSSGMYVLKRAMRSNSTRLGDVVEADRIRAPVEVIARIGEKADRRFTLYNSLECAKEFRLNKYSSKELFWILESVSL